MGLRVPSMVPVTRSSFASRTSDEAWDALSRMYTRARPNVTSPDASIRFEGVATRDIAVDHGWLHTASGSFDESPEQLNFVTVDRGRINLDLGRSGVVGRTAGDCYLYPQNGAADLSWDGLGALTLRLAPQLVAQRAEEMTGMPARDLRFTGVRPLTPEFGRLWNHTVRMLWAELQATGPGVHVLVHRELVSLAAAAAIAAFPNTAMTRGYVPGPGDVRPAAVRRAIAYVDAHASLPITVTDIAGAAGTTPAALRAAFRRHLDTTPTGYLRRVRLERARQDLLANATTARDIAARWGFVRYDRFVTAYREVFGMSPEDSDRSGA